MNPTVDNPLTPAGNRKLSVDTAVATTVSDDGFVRPLPLVIATVYVPAVAAV